MTQSNPIHRPTIQRAHTYSLFLEDAGLTPKIADLPGKYLQESAGGDGTKYFKADIDGALGQGMTAEEFRACLNEARSFLEYPTSITIKVAALCQAFRETVFEKTERWDALLNGRPLDEKRSALEELARKARSLAFNEETQKYDPIVIDSIAKQIKDLFTKHLGSVPIGHVRRLLQRADDRPEAASAGSSLADYGLRELRDKVQRIRRSRDGETVELVANFSVKSIRSGQARFLDGHTEPMHVVDVKCATGEELSLEFRGSLFDGACYENASGFKLTVADPKGFKTYISFKIECDKTQKFDPAVNRVFLVGAFLNDEGELVPNDNVAFTHKREECWYDRHKFATTGNRKVFHRIAALQTNDSVRLLLVWGLGTLLKPALGSAYPHCLVTGDSGTGKDTICASCRERFGWPSFAGPAEFCTPYRSKKATANAVMPIQVQEIGRLKHRSTCNLVEVANLSYNIQPTTHGHLNKTYTLCVPLLLWGQDFAVDDVALNAKMIRLGLTNDGKDSDALRKLRMHTNRWPMKEWSVFVCEWANKRDIKALAQGKAEWLHGQIDTDSYAHTSNSDRTIWNYGVLLVVADALTAFGVPINIEGSVVARVRQHLGDAKRDRATIARQVIHDLLIEIQKRGTNGAFIFDVTSVGLFFKPENAFPELRRRGYCYDISSPKKLTEMLSAEGLGESSVRHRVGRIQSRFFRVPDQVLAEFDFECGIGDGNCDSCDDL